MARPEVMALSIAMAHSSRVVLSNLMVRSSAVVPVMDLAHSGYMMRSGALVRSPVWVLSMITGSLSFNGASSRTLARS